jgi:hypothetical protein
LNAQEKAFVRNDMKAIFLRFVLPVVLMSSAVSCTTAYDAYGNPQTVVTPEGAVLGAAAAGLLAYGIAESNHHHRDRHYHRGSYRYSRYHRGHYH